VSIGDLEDGVVRADAEAVVATETVAAGQASASS
jgi:hypothetical protein